MINKINFLLVTNEGRLQPSSLPEKKNSHETLYKQIHAVEMVILCPSYQS